MCLFTLKITVITPVTWNNCHVSLLLMKVQFLLKDAWSSNLLYWQQPASFSSSGLVNKAQEQFRKTGPRIPSLPPHCFPQAWGKLWLKEEMNYYFTFMIRQKMLICNLPKGSCSWQVREEAWGARPSTTQCSRGHHRTLQVDENCWTRNSSIKIPNNQVMTIECQKTHKKQGEWERIIKLKTWNGFSLTRLLKYFLSWSSFQLHLYWVCLTCLFAPSGQLWAKLLK